jgi:hypothetical protein
MIEFYIPMRFPRPLKTASQVQSGKIVEFCLKRRNRPSISNRYNAQSACRFCEVVSALACSWVRSTNVVEFTMDEEKSDE